MRGVVRNEVNKATLHKQSALVAQCHEQGQLEFVVIPEFTAKGAFDEALADITVIIHLASPLATEVINYTSLHAFATFTVFETNTNADNFPTGWRL